jgi:hypothetical protein
VLQELSICILKSVEKNDPVKDILIDSIPLIGITCLKMVVDKKKKKENLSLESPEFSTTIGFPL